MPVSSYILRCSQENQPSVLQSLRAMDPSQISVGNPTSDGIPVATATDTTREATELGDHLQAIPGVAGAILVYHNFEDLQDAKDPESHSATSHPGL